MNTQVKEADSSTLAELAENVGEADSPTKSLTRAVFANLAATDLRGAELNGAVLAGTKLPALFGESETRPAAV